MPLAHLRRRLVGLLRTAAAAPGRTRPPTRLISSNPNTSITQVRSQLPKHPVYAKICFTQRDYDPIHEEQMSNRGREAKYKGKELLDGLEYCGRIIQERDYDNLLAVALMPSETRGQVFGMLALNAEVSVIRQKFEQKIKRNSGVTGIYQLQFWKDALGILADKQPGPLPRQPVLYVLRSYWDEAHIHMLMKLVEARQETLGDRPFETLGQLEYNCECIYATQILGWMNALKTAYSMRMRGPDDNKVVQSDPTPELAAFQRDTPLPKDAKSVEDVARKMGRAVGILTTLRATVPLLREGAVLLPKDVMAMHALGEEAIARNADPAALKALVRDLCQVSADYLLSARAGRHLVRNELRPALLVSGIRADHLLREFRRCDYNVLDARLHSNNTFVAWRLRWRLSRNIY